MLLKGNFKGTKWNKLSTKICEHIIFKSNLYFRAISAWPTEGATWKHQNEGKSRAAKRITQGKNHFPQFNDHRRVLGWKLVFLLPVWKQNCCVELPELASQMIVVWKMRARCEKRTTWRRWSGKTADLIDASCQNQVALFVPFQGENRAFVLTKGGLEATCCWKRKKRIASEIRYAWRWKETDRK